MPESNSRNALTEAVYFILLSLQTPLHGYGIMQLVNEYSGGRVVLGSGTLYGAINTMIKKEWIILYRTENKKKEYLITDLGKTVLAEEIKRLKELYECGMKVTGGSNES